MAQVEPIFTVVIPTHQRIEFLRDALISVRQQTLSDFECIVVGDDESERNAVAGVVAELDDPRFSYVFNDREKGGNGSRNVGIGRARGRYIAFLDDDDWWFPEKLARHRDRHESGSAALVFSSARLAVEPQWRLCGLWRAPERIDNAVEWMIGGRCPATSSIVSVRRDVLQKSGPFDPELKSVQDWDMWLRVAEVGPFATIDQPLAAFRQHAGDRTSRNPDRRRLGIEQIEQKWARKYQIAGFVHGLRTRLRLEEAMQRASGGERLLGLRLGLSTIWEDHTDASLQERLRLTLQLTRAALR